MSFIKTIYKAKIYFFLIFTAVITPLAEANEFPIDPRNNKLDVVVEKYYNAGLFTGVVLISEKGKIIFLKSYGMANREHSVTNKPSTKFRLGSITKQFTAAAIMILQQEGLLSIHDSIRKYIPDYPPQGNNITIHHLLTHTSGIPEYIEFPDFEKLMNHKYSLAEVVNLFKNKPLEFEPGTKWSYSNSGYVLLALIIEKASNMSFDSFLKKKIFDAANLQDTLSDDPVKLTPNRAQGYSLFSDGEIENTSYIDLSIANGAGNLLSNVTDLLKWDSVLYGNSILSEYSKAEMFKDQTGENYGYGWAVDTAFGHKRVRHGGAIPGFLSEFSRYIDANVTVIVWNNTISGDPNREMADALAAVVFEKPSFILKSPVSNYLKYY